MLELSDYLGLTTEGAKQQWRAMLTRSDGGKRQEAFCPVETLLCFGLGLTGEPNSSGKVNIRESDPSAKMLALIAKRPVGSLGLKLANLDGRRANGAKNEQALWNELTEDLSRFMYLYEIVLTAAREVGIESDRLPDFLGLESRSLEAVLDADRVSTDDLRHSVDSDVKSWADAHPGEDFRPTERAMVGTARIGQKQFARQVLMNGNFACVFCGLSLQNSGLPSSRMLVASHIKEWRHSESTERIDVRNGLATCPTHDAAFDGHLFTVDALFQVVHSPALRRAIEVNPILSRNFGPEGMSLRLDLGAAAILPGANYLAWHTAETNRLIRKDLIK
jgi:putative restriction endonuclease